MRFRTGATLIAVALLGGCASVASDPAPGGSAPMSIVHHAIARPRRGIDTTFWGSVMALDPEGATAHATTVSQSFFANALRLLVGGDVGGAEVMFRSLLDDRDPLIRVRSRIGVTLALEAQGKWSELAQLPRAAWSPGDTLAAVDRAGVDAWAGVLREVPTVEVSAPVVPDLQAITPSAIGTPIIEVRVNGHRRHFWLDTGASMSLIASDVAADCGVTTLGRDTLAIAAAAGRVAARPGIVDSLSLGAVTIRHLPVALLEDPLLRMDGRVSGDRIRNVTIDGVLGADVLRRLSVVIDMNAGVVTFARPASRGAKERRLVWVGYPVVRLLTRDGRPVLFGLDTGADSTIVTDAWLDVTPDPSLQPYRGSIRGLGDSSVTSLPELRYVALDDGTRLMRLRDVPMVPERRQTFVAFHGVLGANILTGVAIHLDITNGIFEIRDPGKSPNTGLTVTSH